MIVLAVTSALFVAAALLINGKQNQAAFNQSIQQARAHIQQVMNEVAAGYFPNNSNFQCTAAAGGPVQLSGVSANEQGENAGCVFAGKVMQFKQGADPEHVAIFTLAGGQKRTGGQEVTSLAEARPIVVAKGNTSPSNYPDITVTEALQNGLKTSVASTYMWYNNGGSDVRIGAVAFVPSFAQYGGTYLDSGSQRISVVAIPNTAGAPAFTQAQAADAINANLTSGVIDPTNGVSICFASGGTDQSGLITIGGSRGPLAVNLKIMQGTQTCGK